MAPKLRISAGPSKENLSLVAVNHDELPIVIDSEDFQGRIAVRVKDFHGELPDGVESLKQSAYFSEPYGSKFSYSIQIQGRFLDELTADDILFGNDFDAPIRVRTHSLHEGFTTTRNELVFTFPDLHRS